MADSQQSGSFDFLHNPESFWNIYDWELHKPLMFTLSQATAALKALWAAFAEW